MLLRKYKIGKIHYRSTEINYSKLEKFKRLEIKDKMGKCVYCKLYQECCCKHKYFRLGKGGITELCKIYITYFYIAH